MFGGSGSKLIPRKKLKRNFICSEINPDYYKMILDGLNNNGTIKDEFKISFKNKLKIKDWNNDLYLFNKI